MKSWSSTQGSIAMSSGEAEYYACTKVAAEALGIQSLAADLGWVLPIVIFIDASAAKSVASRIGLGKLRHLEVKYLWLQEAGRKGRFVLRKVRGTTIPGDFLTKPLSAAEMASLLASLGGVLIQRGTGPRPEATRCSDM